MPRPYTKELIKEIHLNLAEIKLLLGDVYMRQEETPGEKPTRQVSLSTWHSVQDVINAWAKSQFGGMRPPNQEAFGRQSIITLDSQYASITQEDADMILQETNVDDIVWQENKTDCDNIAAYMASRVSVIYGLNSVAIVDAIDEGHSYCAFLLRDINGTPYFRAFEPQTDQWRDDVRPKLGWFHLR